MRIICKIINKIPGMDFGEKLIAIFLFIIIMMFIFFHAIEVKLAEFALSLSSIILSLIIFYYQYKQSCRIENFEKRQDKRDEERHAESIKSKAISFISKYYSERGLIPLCAIAAMHNEIYYYSKEMYREFCCLTTETQNCILKYLKLDLRVKEDKKFFENCINILEKEVKNFSPKDETTPFYDNGKYILCGLINYGEEKIPLKKINYKPHRASIPIASRTFDGTAHYDECITDVLSDYIRGDSECKDTPIIYLMNFYNWYNTEDIKACQFCMTLAVYISNSIGNKYKTSKDYGSPGGYEFETIDTMEDLFLLCLFEIYTNLILKKEGNQNENSPI